MYKSIIISQIIATVYFNAKDSEAPGFKGHYFTGLYANNHLNKYSLNTQFCNQSKIGGKCCNIHGSED